MSPSSSWKRVQIGEHPADVLETNASPARVILFLHGHGQQTLKDSEAFTTALAQQGFSVVCPLGKRSWWLDVVCSEFSAVTTPLEYLRETVVPWICDKWQIDTHSIGLLGVSMGGQGVLQLAYRHGREFRVVAAISPIIDFYQCYGHGLPLDEMFTDAEEARQASVSLQIHPLNWPPHQLLLCDPQDPWYEGTDRLAMKLSASGIPFESDLETSAGGHTWNYFEHQSQRAAEFLADRL